MKKLFTRSFLILGLLTLFSFTVFNFQFLETGNQDWNALQYGAIDDSLVNPDVEYDLAISDVISNNSDAENIDILVRFDEILPGQTVNGSSISYRIFVYLEEEVVPGFWNSIADNTQQLYGDFVNGPTEVEFIIQTNSFADQGQPFNSANGFRWFINKSPSERMRVRIAILDINPESQASFQSLKVTGAFRLY